jgi:TolB-like protein/DNA-binding winged helix-turn-helix (wHTH) protein/Tfp pilus assembly protein PilF
MNGCETGARVLGFGHFEVDVRRGELRKHGIRIKLQDKPFQILIMLLEQPGEVVTRESLRQRLWDADTFVDFDQGLNSAMKKLRQALGDSAESPRFVETQARRGYRFLAPVRVIQPVPSPVAPPAIAAGAPALEHTESAAPAVRLRRRRLGWLAAAMVATVLAGLWSARFWRKRGQPLPGRIQSIAVLPLANLSAGADQQYFADGLTDALIGDLARIGALRVISRTSAMQYRGTHKLLPEIARELRVDGVVEGAVQRLGSRVRISAQLVEGAGDRPLWSQSYERDVKDILTLQNEIAAAIAQQIRVRITPREQVQLASSRATDPAAYEDYLRGRFFWNNRSADGLAKGVQYFRQALEKDPHYALAYAGLADCYNMFSYYGVASPGEAFPQAKKAALRALELDSELAEAHAALAFCKVHYDWDWAGAESEFKRALTLNPGYANAHHWYSHYLLATGQMENSLAESGTALALDPLNLSINNHMSHEYIYAGRFQPAVERLSKALETNPNSTRTHLLLAEAYEGSARLQDAQAELDRAVDLSPGDPQVEAARAHIYAAAGQTGKARELLARLIGWSRQRHIGAYQIAVIYASLREPDQAFQWLRQAWNERADDLCYVNVDPHLRSLRADARMRSLVRRLGLPGVMR